MILITGFQSYGGRDINPSQAVVQALDGAVVGGMAVRGHTLPVDFAAICHQMPALIREVAPRVILSLGLWPGEPVVRVERMATNWCDFELPDATGLRHRGPVIDGGPDGYLTTLPGGTIEAAVRDAGIPCRQSGSAGFYLCNALAYVARHQCAQERPGARAGFMHLPYLPQQVAQLMDQLARDGDMELHQRADLASMDLDRMIAAVTIALETTLDHTDRPAV